tara:strand:- start:1636 stop:2841 length:1206 start_codon:yes stop_codon:yes gene_type:complete
MIEAIKSQLPHRLYMHILVMTRIMPGHSLGGMQKQTMDLCSGFVQSGHEVTVVTTARNDGVEIEIIDGVNICYLSGSKPGYYSRKWNSLCRKKITKLHQENPIDIIHSQSMGAIGVLKWAKKNSIPIVSTWHGTSLTEISTFFSSASYHPRYWHWLIIMPITLLKRYITMDLAVRKASKKITLVSPTLEKNIKFLAKDKVVTIPNGIEIPELDKKSKQKPIHCIAIGRIEKEKGIHYAIKSIANLPEELRNDVVLNIVGQGGYLPTLQRLASDLKIEDFIKFHGRADDETLTEIYHNSRIHLMPTTRQEGLPLTILEGMAYGLATIASDIGGIPGVITNDLDGILTEPGNQNQLDQMLSKLLSNSDMIESIGKAARNTAELRYSKQRMVDETLEVLLEVVK